MNAGHACRVFHISAGKTVTISGLGIVNGSAFNNIGGGIYNEGGTLNVGNTISNACANGNTETAWAALRPLSLKTGERIAGTVRLRTVPALVQLVSFNLEQAAC